MGFRIFDSLESQLPSWPTQFWVYPIIDSVQASVPKGTSERSGTCDAYLAHRKCHFVQHLLKLLLFIQLRSEDLAQLIECY